jgi:hypothetical protein
MSESLRLALRDAAINALFTGVIVVVGAGALSLAVNDRLTESLSNEATCENPGELTLLSGSDIVASGEYLTYETKSGSLTYPPSALVDSTRSTAWVSADDGAEQGVSAQVTLTLDGEQDVRLICALNGYAKGADYRENPSVRVLQVSTAQGDRDATLPPLTEENAFTYQPVVFAPGRTSELVFTVRVTDPPVTPSLTNGPTSATMSEIELWVAD